MSWHQIDGLCSHPEIYGCVENCICNHAITLGIGFESQNVFEVIRKISLS